MYVCNYVLISIWKFVNVLSQFCYLPLEKERAFHLNKLKSPSPKDDLCKVGWKWPSYSEENFKNVLINFAIVLLSPLGKRRCPSLNNIQPGILCAKFGWKWPSDSEEDFQFVNVLSHFRNYFPLEKGVTLHLNKIESPSLSIFV